MSDLTLDDFLGGAVKAYQPRKGFRAGIDSVMLAAAVPARPGDQMLEAGIGPGVAAMCLAHRLPDCHITGVEIQPEIAALARQNAEKGGQIRVVCADATARPAPLKDQQFDHAYANPPFFDVAKGLLSPDISKARSLAISADGLERFVDFMIRRTKEGGTVTIVHRAEKLADLLALSAGRLGGLAVFPLWPRAGAAAKLVLVQGTKGSKAPLTITAGLVLHETDNSFTPQAQAILRHGERLTLVAPMPTSI
ncbi:MAG: tRNA1(Val) (adenine(37)-N6)-methyltransferase [Alphaproteobacteria bacterium]